MRKKISLVCLLTIFLFSFSFKDYLKLSQSFSGDWKINTQQSDAPQSAPKEIRLQQTTDSVFIERITIDGQSFTEKISFDGKISTSTTTSGRRKSGSAKWDGQGKSFTENATLSDADNPNTVAFTVTEQWQLSDDQAQLSVLTTISNASGASGRRKDVYDRQS